jgi:hypothetical protein
MAKEANEFLASQVDLEAVVAEKGTAREAGEAAWQMLVEPIHRRLEFNDRVDRPVWDSLTPGQHALLAAWLLRETVESHGFLHYLFEAGAMVPQALAGLRRIGAGEQAARIEWAIRQLPGGVAPDDPAAWPRLLRKIPPEAKAKVFGPMKEELLSEKGFSRSVAECVLEYVRAHPNEFFR